MLAGMEEGRGKICLKVFFKRSFNKRKDRAVFCIGKMFNRKSYADVIDFYSYRLYINE